MGVDKEGNSVELDVISGPSANAHCTNLQQFFDAAISAGRWVGDNPFVKLKRHSEGEQGGGAEAFTEGELKAIFDPSTFMQAKRSTQFWGPLLALYTGARLNELACLDLDDFVTEKGIPCISIRHIKRAKPATIGHKASKATAAARQTKTVASRRMVPLHPDLFEIGLVEYIEDMRSIGATRFFPTLPVSKKTMKRERALSYDGNQYLKKVGVHVHRTKVMHGFRDTVCDMLGLSDMDDFKADQWTGHANQSIKGKHYRRKVAIELQAKEGFKALDFPFIDTEALQYRKGWWNDWSQKNLVS
jgi:integrase